MILNILVPFIIVSINIYFKSTEMVFLEMSKIGPIKVVAQDGSQIVLELVLVSQIAENLLKTESLLITQIITTLVRLKSMRLAKRYVL